MPDLNFNTHLDQLANPSRLTPYLIATENGDIETTNFFRMCYETICGWCGGKDMCNVSLVGCNLMYQICEHTDDINFDTINKIDSICVRAGLLLPKDTRTLLNKKIDEFINKLGLFNSKNVDKGILKTQIQVITKEYYKANSDSLAKYSQILPKFFTKLDIPPSNDSKQTSKSDDTDSASTKQDDQTSSVPSYVKPSIILTPVSTLKSNESEVSDNYSDDIESSDEPNPYIGMEIDGEYEDDGVEVYNPDDEEISEEGSDKPKISKNI